MRNRFEAGDTIQFTLTTSVAPDLAPSFAMYWPNSTALLTSLTAAQSATTAYYALVTMPNSSNVVYMGEWIVKKTVSGSQHPFVRRFVFNVDYTLVVQ